MQKYGKGYYICLYNKVPVGFIGIVDNDVRLAVIKDVQNNGIGSFMLSEIEKIRPGFFVQVKKTNIPSIKLFEKNNYLLEKTEMKNGVEILTMKKKLI